ncbi:MAG: DEAD/DEAH box helicase family protein [Bacteroidaceae bacterium]|nr:DEAD/DEAH box helicase family protein [Bacteroidaceae bacterium]
MNQIAFQIDAVDRLVQLIKSLWTRDENMIPIVLKAPTGSGKTYMTEKLICDLAEQPDWDGNVAYVWITFSEDLALQSKEKFDLYFPTTKHGRLLTIEDFNLGKMQKNDVLFLNWQKLVSRSAENRIYRRPTDERMRHENRVYFEDFVENTHKDEVEIILIIDESHLNVTDSAYRDVINPLNPKIKLNVSATPKSESLNEAWSYGNIVEIKREDVAAQGLIKENIICQTEEELKKYEGEDMDHILIKLAMDRRKQLKSEIEAFGKDVNPLVIIQLPNDDEDLIKEGQPTKEEIVKEYLISQGVRADRIASWFTGNKKPVGLELNNSPYEYLLFKTAAGTGWDCPRAQVLVMFRDVKSEIFNTQVIGRIMRVPIMNEEVSKVFRNGYIYTNFSRDAVEHAKYGDNSNKPKTLISYNKKNKDFTLDPRLLTDFLSRVDYGDLGKSGEFQQCLFDTFNEFFKINDDDMMDSVKGKLTKKGINVDDGFSHDVISDIEFSDLAKIGVELKRAHQTNREWSRNDVQKWFTLTLVNILKSQTDDDCKVGNIVRATPALKSAIRLWFKCYAMRWENEDRWYRVFLNDVINKGANSVFRMLITKTLKQYHPILEKQLEDRRKENEQRESEPFVLKKMYGFTEEYEEIDVSKCLLVPFYLHKNYTGQQNEMNFAKYLDQQNEIEWWFKNGDNGKDWLSIRYFNEVTNQEALFYPDWIFRKKDGTIGIFDTKGGFTASDPSTKNKAEALHERIKYLNAQPREHIHYVGGIVIYSNNMWYYNDNDTYHYNPRSTDGWKNMNELFGI